MSLRNKDLFQKDPSATKIPNDGVAKVGTPETPEQWDVLRWELGSFVCEGEYERGLDRILTSFLSSLDKANQSPVWVSGFYGSGKSHLVRVLEYLWRDPELPGGDRARSLVDLPDAISAHLVELSTEAKRSGGLWSAAGTLAAGKSDQVRLAFLSILFASAGLPEQYPFARFTLWARANGHLDAITAAVEAAGRTYDDEVRNLYVSPIIAEALLELDHTLTSAKEVRQLLMTQFPHTTTDLTDDETFAAIEEVLLLQSASPGKLPLTLIVLDEMQQYLGDDNTKAIVVQDLVEGCASRFANKVLIVATGQSALGATATLQKLTDRFAVQVALSDTDVESVVRQVILRKRPEHQPALAAALDRVAPEIDRHLGGTQLEAKAADKQDWVADYPLLPTRRRFWELALRGIDRAGKAGVLRTQLKIVHEAARAVAGQPVGHVVGGDFLYDQQAAGMQQSGVLLKEIDELIRGLRIKGADGELKARICALIFLISQLPSRASGSETGVESTAAVLADLLVEDLVDDGARLRKRVPELLDELVQDGRVLQVDDEYLLQTEEGAEWQKAYRGRATGIRDDAPKLNMLRNERLTRAIDAELGNLKPQQGDSKTPRTVRTQWGDEPPSIAEGEVPVWVRDEWSTTEASVKTAAAQAGENSPIIFVLLPRREADAIRDTLASHAAAQETIAQRPTPQTDEGRTAAAAMRTRVDTDEQRLTELFSGVVNDARVFQGGGNEVTTGTLRDAVGGAASSSLVRLFPKFKAADNPNWGKVITKARDGAPDAMAAVGHAGEPLTHPVCKEIHATISAAGTQGAGLLKQFTAGDYGWPPDAVRGAILALLAAGNIRASLNGKALHGPKELLPTQIGKATLLKEDDPPSTQQRIKIRKLLTDAGIPYTTSQESAAVPALLQHLKEMGVRAGGPAPLPDPPDTDHIDGLMALGGNQQLKAVADEAAELTECLTAWQAADQQRAARSASWAQLERLLSHAAGLPVVAAVQPDIDAIVSGRLLLAHPDPISPLRNQITAALRETLKARVSELAQARVAARETLDAWEEWDKVSPARREELLAGADLRTPTEPQTATDEDLLAALDATALSAWQDRISLVPTRLEDVQRQALRDLEPKSVSIKVPTATLKTEQQLDEFLAALRDQVSAHLDGETPVLII